MFQKGDWSLGGRRIVRLLRGSLGEGRVGAGREAYGTKPAARGWLVRGGRGMFFPAFFVAIVSEQEGDDVAFCVVFEGEAGGG